MIFIPPILKDIELVVKNGCFKEVVLTEILSLRYLWKIRTWLP